MRQKRHAGQNVGLAGESGRYPQVAFESGRSHNRKFGTADHYIDFHITLG
jgi:hypothetical protein